MLGSLNLILLSKINKSNWNFVYNVDRQSPIIINFSTVIFKLLIDV